MNDLTKSINIDKSSLISLKAELLKKKDEVEKLKSTQHFVPKKLEKPVVEKEPKATPRQEKEPDKSDELLLKSQQMLAKKSKFYDYMLKAGSSSRDDGYLVMFDKKQSVENRDDDNLVEYTDCLGRTRKVPQAELTQLMKDDKNLYESAETRQEQFKDNKVFAATLNSINLGEKLLEQREQWKKQDEKNSLENFVHYQDLLYNEAREHGVGYYEFSNDTDRRTEQMEALKKLRDETLESQKKQKNLKSLRDTIIADRVKAARARVMERTGIVVDIPEIKTEEDSEQVEVKEKEPSIEDLEKERLRRQHVRPWDKHKGDNSDDEEWKPKKDKTPMSQAKWNEMKREERNPQFAPVYSESGSKISTENKRKFTSRSYTGSDSHSAIPYQYDNEYPKKPKLDEVPKNELEHSIQAGLKFLRDQVKTDSTEKQMQNKNKWTSKMDY